jgi:hypothetical protein
MTFRQFATTLSVLALVAAAGRASAQTVLVRGLTPGTPVEVAVNGTLAGNASANANGDATVPLGAAGTKAQMDANIYVDTCGERRRIVVVDRSQSAVFTEGDCGRQEIPGVFVVRPVSTLVVSVTGATPTLLLIQGTYDPDAPPKTWQPLPTGLMLFGGSGYTMMGDAPLYACGTVTDCNGDGSGFGFVGGVEYWLWPWLGAEAQFLKPANMTAEGGGTGYKFDTTLEANVITLAGKVGIPVGPVRFYGKAGGNYQRSLYTNSQTIDDTTVTVDEITTVYKGGSITSDYETGGWSWYFGGGGEAWFKARFAIYGEVGWLGLKGENRNDGEGILDDKLTVFLFGGRVKLF